MEGTSIRRYLSLGIDPACVSSSWGYFFLQIFAVHLTVRHCTRECHELMNTFRPETLAFILATERFLNSPLVEPPLSAYERDLIASYCTRVLDRLSEHPNRSAA
jgi:hypothetical protein